MKQLFILSCFFISSFALADHDGIKEHSYNGRTFTCGSHDEEFAKEKPKNGALVYNWALCQLHHNKLDEGIKTLHTAADKLGDLHSAIVLAEYYSSDKYNLPQGEVTDNATNLQKAIKYEKLALNLIWSNKDYPFDDPDSWRIEKEDHVYLKTVNGLTGDYITQFGLRMMDHINGVTTNTNIGNPTIESLQNAIDVATVCLTISYNSAIWSEKIYNNSMKLCRGDKAIAQELKRLEIERLDIARSQCQGMSLSSCPDHVTKKDEMIGLYLEYLDKIDPLLASL